jgi:hypothetical protein
MTIFFYIIFKESFRTSQETRCISINRGQSAKLIREKIAVHSEDHKKDTLPVRTMHSSLLLKQVAYIYSKTCLKRNLKGPEHFSAETRFPFNQGVL